MVIARAHTRTSLDASDRSADGGRGQPGRRRPRGAARAGERGGRHRACLAQGERAAVAGQRHLAGRDRPGAGLRSAGGRAGDGHVVPAAVPRRLPHRARPVDPTGRAGGHARSPTWARTSTARRSIRRSGTATTASARARRSSCTSRGSTWPAVGVAPITDIGASTEHQRPDRAARRDHRPARALLGRARRQRQRRQRAGAADPSGRELRRRAPHHRRHAEPRATAAGTSSSPSARSSATTATAVTRCRLRPSRTASSHMEAIFTELAAAPRGAQRASTWPGTSPSPARRASPGA